LKQARLQIGLAFIGFVVIGISGGANGVLLPSLSSYYRVDNTVIGLIFITSSVGYFLSAFTSSLLLEKLGKRMFLTMGTLAFLLGTLIFAVEPPFIVILATRFLIGFGIAIIETGLNAFIVEFRSTSMMNSLHAFFGVGSLIGPVVAAAMLSVWQWNSVYILLSLICLLLLIGFFTIFIPQFATANTHSNEKHEKSKAPQAQPQQNVLIAALKLPVVWLAALFLLLYTGVEVSLGNWSYSFLTEGRHLSNLFSSTVVSGFWLGLTMGRFILSALSERFGLSPVSLIYLCIGGVVLSSLAIWLVPFSAPTAVSFCLLGLCLGPIYPTTIALVPRLVSNRLIASAIGFLVSLSTVGIGLLPWLAGTLAQFMGLWSLLPYVIGLCGLMLLFWWATFRRSSPAQPKTAKADGTASLPL
jgi:fucose permease